MSSAGRRMKLKDSAYSRVLKELIDLDEAIRTYMETLGGTIEDENNPDLVNMGALIALLAMIIEDIPGLDGKDVVELLLNAIEARRRNGSTIH